VIVPADDERLLSGGAGAASSPWVIAIVRGGIPVLPHIINAVILTSAASSGNAFLYTGSRYLFALAQNGQAPRVFLTCTKAGVPVYCVLATASVGLLTYMTVSSGANNVFGWFQTVSCRLERRRFPTNTDPNTAHNHHLPLHLDLHPHRLPRLPQSLRRPGCNARRPTFQLQVPALHRLHRAGLLHHDRYLQRLESLHPRRHHRRVQLVDPGLRHCVSSSPDSIHLLRQCTLFPVLTLLFLADTWLSRSTSASSSSGNFTRRPSSSRRRKPIFGLARRLSMLRSGLSKLRGTSSRGSGFGLHERFPGVFEWVGRRVRTALDGCLSGHRLDHLLQMSEAEHTRDATRCIVGLQRVAWNDECGCWLLMMTGY
jgi:hypothetical protein